MASNFRKESWYLNVMNSENKNETLRHSPFRNWMSQAGAVLTAGSFFSFLLLFVLDSLAHFSNPYVGILTYMVAPGFGAMGIFLIILGLWIARRRIARNGGMPAMRIDLSRPRDRKMLALFVAGAVVFLLVSAVGSYQTYHYTESV